MRYPPEKKSSSLAGVNLLNETGEDVDEMVESRIRSVAIVDLRYVADSVKERES